MLSQTQNGRGQDGLAELNIAMARDLKRRIVKFLPDGLAQRGLPTASTGQIDTSLVAMSHERVAPKGLRIEHLTVRFGGVCPVRDVSLRVKPGTIHGLLGPNGAGKTTLVDAVTGFVRAEAGTVWVGDQDVSNARPLHRSRFGIRRSFQSIELFEDLTARENIAVGCDEGGRLRYFLDLFWPGSVSLSSTARASASFFHLENDLDADVRSLSFGKRRLIATARAVASGPSVLLLDEPAAGLDDGESAEFATLIRTLADEWGMAILLIEHNVDLVLAVSDEVTVLDQGMVLMNGTPEEVRTHPEVIAAYLGSDLNVDERGSTQEVANGAARTPAAAQAAITDDE
jgi:ABC-type branched-subunit amino acid transport system ATPase component